MTEIYVWFWDHTPAWTFEIFQSSRTVFVLFACILMYVLVQVATQRELSDSAACYAKTKPATPWRHSLTDSPPWDTSEIAGRRITLTIRGERHDHHRFD